ncbi:flavodoxin domain-containing protein [bacterium]|nr:flavodoxin domain-containing protein [bacterium]
MTKHLEAIKVSEHVYWVGAVDWISRDFHGYAMPHGTTYNAFLVMADKITLVDTVKAQFRDELMTRISSVVDPSEIEFIVSNHSEMDHTGCLMDVADIVGPERIVASPMGQKTIAMQLHGRHDVDVVKDGETLDLGNMRLDFYETRMLHWPDSMFSYLEADRVLFSQDAFGMHYASCERFDDQLDPSLLERESGKYYANILMPYSPIVEKLADRMGVLDLALDVVAPDHGPLWRKDIAGIVGRYVKWAKQEPTMKAVVVFDTMWGSTEKMARAIGQGLYDEGARARLLPLSGTDRATVAAEILEAGALLLGSPTINNQMFPRMADILCYLKGLKPRNLVGGVFGSYGWSGEAIAQLTASLGDMRIDVVGDPMATKFVPDDDVLRRCREFGQTMAVEMKRRAA